MLSAWAQVESHKGGADKQQSEEGAGGATLLNMAGGATPLRYGFRRKAGGGCSLGESRDKAVTSGKE